MCQQSTTLPPRTPSSSCGPVSWVAYPLFMPVSQYANPLHHLLIYVVALTLRSFWRRRLEINSVLSKSCASLTTSRYLRLMVLSCVEMSTNVPLGAYSIYINIGGVTIARWTNWADVHYNFWFVEKFPETVWKRNHQFFVAVEMGRWIYPCSAIVFFALFGFADEARRQYSALFWSIARKFGFQPRVRQGTLLSF